MAIKDNQRPGSERRVFNLTDCEVRAADADSPAVFSGYAAVFNDLSVNLGGFRERIQPGCFRAAVDEGQDVRFLINHDANLLLGRSTSGTLTLAEDEIGLRVECELPNTSYANDLAESMRRGDIDQMSFGFKTVADEWNERDEESGLPIRELVRADLFDASVVTYPAYPTTSAELRAEIEEQSPELVERAKRAAEELEAVELVERAKTPETPATEEAPEEPIVEAPETPEETPAEEPAARQGKVLSNKNKDTLQAAKELLDEVLSAADAGEISVGEADDILMVNATGTNDGRDTENDQLGVTPEAMVDIVRPDMRAFREWVAERGWGYDDDWNIWSLTQMIEAGSCFLLFADDPNDEDGAEDAPLVAGMKTVMGTLAELLAAVVAEGVREEEQPEAEQPAAEQRDDEEPDEPGRFDRERRRLALAERELELQLVG